MDKFKTTFKKKVDGRINNHKPSTSAPRSDRGGGKFILIIFS
jgi:hypothetical protein